MLGLVPALSLSRAGKDGQSNPGLSVRGFDVWSIICTHLCGVLSFQGLKFGVGIGQVILNFRVLAVALRLRFLVDRALGSMTCEFGTLNTRDGSRCQSFVCTLVMVYS